MVGSWFWLQLVGVSCCCCCGCCWLVIAPGSSSCRLAGWLQRGSRIRRSSPRMVADGAAVSETRATRLTSGGRHHWDQQSAACSRLGPRRPGSGRPPCRPDKQRADTCRRSFIRPAACCSARVCRARGGRRMGAGAQFVLRNPFRPNSPNPTPRRSPKSVRMQTTLRPAATCCSRWNWFGIAPAAAAATVWTVSS